MSTLPSLSAEDVDRLLDFPALIGRLRQAFSGSIVAPARHHHAIGPQHDATHLLMPAWTANAPAKDAFLGTKIVNIFRGNARLGLATVLGSYVLQSGESGAPLTIMDGTRLTHWRTAAASALAASFLARDDSRHLLMVGAGAMAPFLIRAHAVARPITQVTIWNRSRAGAEALAQRVNLAGLDASVANDLEHAVGAADVISCATLSTEPLIRGAWLQPGQHVDLVGAFTLGMREADDASLQRARVFIDTDDARYEGGDVAVALRDGVLTQDRILGTLFDLCQSNVAGRTSAHDLTLFKSTGTALEDLAAAMLVWHRLSNPACL